MLSNDPRLRSHRNDRRPQTVTVNLIIEGRPPYVTRVDLSRPPELGDVFRCSGAEWRIVRVGRSDVEAMLVAPVAHP